MKIRVLFIVLFLFASAKVLAQAPNGAQFPVRVAVKLVDLATGKPVPYASARILNTTKGTMADSNGFFTMVISQKDTLRVSSLGYHDLYYVKDPYRQTSYYVTLGMRSRIFVLEAVEIVSKRYRDLNHPMLRWEYKARFLPKVWLFYEPTGEPPPQADLMSPISFLYDRFSRRGKATRKLRDMVAERARKKRNAVKYNAAKVQKWTGLGDEEIGEFMNFCPMPDAFIDESTEYQIIEKVFRCLEDFDNREDER